MKFFSGIDVDTKLLFTDTANDRVGINITNAYATLAVGGNAIGHIDVPEDYRDYVKSKLSKPSRATKVEFSAAAEECTSDCLYW